MHHKMADYGNWWNKGREIKERAQGQMSESSLSPLSLALSVEAVQSCICIHDQGVQGLQLKKEILMSIL